MFSRSLSANSMTSFLGLCLLMVFLSWLWGIIFLLLCMLVILDGLLDLANSMLSSEFCYSFKEAGL